MKSEQVVKDMLKFLLVYGNSNDSSWNCKIETLCWVLGKPKCLKL